MPLILILEYEYFYMYKNQARSRNKRIVQTYIYICATFVEFLSVKKKVTLKNKNFVFNSKSL